MQSFNDNKGISPQDNYVSTCQSINCALDINFENLSMLVIDQIPFAIIVVDMDGRIVLANRASNIFASESVSIETGTPIAETMARLGMARDFGAISILLQTDGHWRGNLLLNGPDGLSREIGLVVTRKKTEQSSYFDLYIGYDKSLEINERRKETQDARNSTRSELAGEISHELNNFLSISMGNLELMAMAIERGKFETLGSRLKTAREGLNRIARYVEALMSISRQDQKTEVIELHRFLDEELMYLTHEPDFAGIEIIRKWAPDIPYIDLDKGRFQQAFYNLMINARDAVAANSTKRITIATSISEVDGYVRLAISDNGPGLAEEDYAKIYRQHFTTKGPGHGFGLLSVKGMIKSQGGRVAVGPNPDGGACFTVELPTVKGNGGLK